MGTRRYAPPKLRASSAVHSARSPLGPAGRIDGVFTGDVFGCLRVCGRGWGPGKSQVGAAGVGSVRRDAPDVKQTTDPSRGSSSEILSRWIRQERSELRRDAGGCLSGWPILILIVFTEMIAIILLSCHLSSWDV